MKEVIEKEYEIGYNELSDKLGLEVDIIEVEVDDIKRKAYIKTRDTKETK